MVTIRSLRPSVQIRLPPRADRYKLRHDNAQARVHVTRRLLDFPPPTPLGTPCRLWQGAVNRGGYGWRKVGARGQRQTVLMHRWVMETILERTLRRDEVVMHLCDNRLCYRADHLRVGTVRDNNEDMVNKGRLVHVANASPGERNARAKLSQRQVDHIRRLYRDGLRQGTIAEQYNISISTVSRVVRGVTWATGPERDLLAEARARLEAGNE